MSSSSRVDHFHHALEYALESIGKFELFLKEAQHEAMTNISKCTI